MFDREKSNELFDRVLALTDELRHEGMAYTDYSNLYDVITGLYDSFSEVDSTIEALKLENEQLKAKAVRYRDALEKVDKCFFSGECEPFDVRTPVKNALSDTPAERIKTFEG